MATDIPDSELQRLSTRWGQDPSPHLTLQLADAHRQRDRTAEALPILERGLELHPDHVSIQVALGRYRLEAADAEGAASVLRRVVDKDPGHLVANKLLVRAHLALGDRRGAADRLELYSLLNDSDPDLEALRSSVESELPSHSADVARPPLPAAFGSPPAAPPADLGFLAGPAKRRVSGGSTRDPFGELSADPLTGEALVGVFLPETAPAVTQRAAPPPAPVRSDTAVEPPTAEPGEPAELEIGAGATATLGSLYLAQGHLADAQRTFEQVLVRDPDDAEAQAGLTELARRSGGAQPDLAPSDPAKTAKIARLQQYLSRIRAAAERLSA